MSQKCGGAYRSRSRIYPPPRGLPIIITTPLRHISLPTYTHTYNSRFSFRNTLSKPLFFPLCSSLPLPTLSLHLIAILTSQSKRDSKQKTHLCAFVAKLSCALLPYRARMTLLSDIISASAHLHSSNHLPSDEYDRRIRELVEYFRRLQTTKALESFANDESFLDVSTFTYITYCFSEVSIGWQLMFICL